MDERLQTGQNPIDVDFSAIDQSPVVVGSYFTDKQGRSFVLAIDTGQASPSVTDCPQPTPPPTDGTGSLLVTKALAGDLTGFVAGDFVFSIMCDATSYGPVTINLASGSASAQPITGIPAGAVCTVTETSRANPGTNWTWGAVPAAGSATIVANQQASVTITNTRSSTPPPTDNSGSLTITKSVAGAGDWAGGTFTFSVSCTDPSFSKTDVTITTATTGTAAVSGIPLNSGGTNSCTVVETGKAAVPAGHTAWVTTYAPDSGVTAVSQQTAGAVTVTNTTSTKPPQAPQTPGSSVEGATGTPGTPPTGVVAGATGHPHLTPPPTSALGSVPAQPASDTWRIALLGLAALLATLMILSSRTTSPARRRP